MGSPPKLYLVRILNGKICAEKLVSCKPGVEKFPILPIVGQIWLNPSLRRPVPISIQIILFNIKKTIVLFLQSMKVVSIYFKLRIKISRFKSALFENVAFDVQSFRF